MAKNHQASDEIGPEVAEVLLGQLIRELLGEVQNLPPTSSAERQKTLAVIEQVVATVRAKRGKMQSVIHDLQDSLDQIRLLVKYLLFDLEATRRENKYLRRWIEEQLGGDMLSS